MDLKVSDDRPFFESEHGPIHSFKDHDLVLAEDFDDEYFRHMQWAHVASGAAGGGMRWPNRHPHILTPGMHLTQRALHAFLRLIRWTDFCRKNISHEMTVRKRDAFAWFGCSDGSQAILYLLRSNNRNERGMIDTAAAGVQAFVEVPNFEPGPCVITEWDTQRGAAIMRRHTTISEDRVLRFESTPIVDDLAIAIQRDS